MVFPKKVNNNHLLEKNFRERLCGTLFGKWDVLALNMDINTDIYRKPYGLCMSSFSCQLHKYLYFGKPLPSEEQDPGVMQPAF